MNDLDLISLMVEETMSMAHSSVYNFRIDIKRSCFVLELPQVVEIPLGFGPIPLNPTKDFIIDAEDSYLYPLICKLLDREGVTLEFSLENEQITISPTPSANVTTLRIAA